MDLAKLIERFATIHGRRPESKHELESSFAKYASSPDGWILIRKRMARLVRQMQIQCRFAVSRSGLQGRIQPERAPHFHHKGCQAVHRGWRELT
jgi:hypothetical protein